MNLFSKFKKLKSVEKPETIVPKAEHELTSEELEIFDLLYKKGKEEVWDPKYAVSPCPIPNFKKGK